MTLREYMSEIKKDNCPEACELRSRVDIRIATVPPPSNEILGVLISRDPTVRWLEKGYEDAMDTCKEESHIRRALFDTAIPQMILKRIEDFMEDQMRLKCLSDMIFQKVYWTHLHKCFTDASGKESLKFNPANGKKCADKWLAEELRIVLKNNKIRFIIALGKDVQRWVRKQQEKKEGLYKSVQIINLLHPSPQNSIIWKRTAIKMIEDTEEQIRTLVRLCDAD